MMNNEPPYAVMRVTTFDGEVHWLDGHDEQDAFASFGTDVTIEHLEAFLPGGDLA